ncbi:hypothetical protein [Phenylobacterium sp.]|uniref:hypothetical protein n=1 Tax=Phenylobacterium sp. TaxID=1871053 RepID=UPI002C97E178|nr:hypothetical protein [Phenylobacterium sp.]HLZ75576.1 hypothetical protein [Phenylobacterium sp.]
MADETTGPRAKPKQKDKGTVVHTAFGQKMDGHLSDIADGDDARNTKAAKPDDGKAHPGQKDKGKVVTSAFGEKMGGHLSDIADGDD